MVTLSQGESSDDTEGAEGAELQSVVHGSYALEDEMNAMYLEWQRQKQIYEHEVNELWTKKSQLDKMKLQCQRDVALVAEHQKKLEHQSAQQRLKIAELEQHDQDLEEQLIHGRRFSGADDDSTPHQRKMNDAELVEEASGQAAEQQDPEVCCWCPCPCRYELRCVRNPFSQRERQSEEEGTT